MDNESLDIRAVLVTRTTADLAALPLQKEDAIDPVKLQKLPERVIKHFGDIGYSVIRPALIPHREGRFRFPRYEIVVGLANHDEVLVFYQDEWPADIQLAVRNALKQMMTQQEPARDPLSRAQEA